MKFLCDESLRHGLRTALAIVIATYLTFYFHLENPYWAGITIALIMTPTLGAHFERAGARLLGTWAGGFLAFFIAGFVSHSMFFYLLSVFLLVGGGLFFYFTTAYPYAFLIFSITGFLILGELIYNSNHVFKMMVWRISEITLAVLVAWIVSYLVFPSSGRKIISKRLQNIALKNADYFELIMKHYLSPDLGPIPPEDKDIDKEFASLETLIFQSRIELLMDPVESLLLHRLLMALKRILRQLRHLAHQYHPEESYSLLRQEKNTFSEVSQSFYSCLSHFSDLLKKEDALKEPSQTLLKHMKQCIQIINETLRTQQEKISSQELFLTEGFATHLETFALDMTRLATEGPSKTSIETQKNLLQNTTFLRKDEKKEAVRLSIKGGLSAVLALVLWIQTHWPGGLQGIISSIFFSSQRVVDDARLLAKLNLMGCLVGAALGMMALYVFQFNLTFLLLLLFIVTAFFATLSAKSKTYGMGAIQANFAFILCLVSKAGPSADIALPLQRVAGIILGIIATFIVSQLLWPSPTEKVLQQYLSKGLSAIKTLYDNFLKKDMPPQDAIIQERLALHDTLKRSKELLNSFTIHHQDTHPLVLRGNQSVAVLTGLASVLYSFMDESMTPSVHELSNKMKIPLGSLLETTVQLIHSLEIKECALEVPSSLQEELHSLLQELEKDSHVLHEHFFDKEQDLHDNMLLLKCFKDWIHLLRVLEKLRPEPPTLSPLRGRGLGKGGCISNSMKNNQG